MGTLRDVALECFSQAATRPDYERQLDERKRQLVKQGKQRLTEVAAQDVEQAEHDLSADAKKPGDAARNCTRALRYWRRRRGRERQAFTEAELREAWKRLDMAMVAKVARSLARTGTGVKNRNYRAHPACNPTKADWSNFLGRDSLAGGLDGNVATIPFCHNLAAERLTDLKNTDEYAIPDIFDNTEDIVKRGSQGFKMTIKALRRTRIGKDAPAWSVPAEIYQ
eukprot:7074004-Pyramimonas_sp.AAC.1